MIRRVDTRTIQRGMSPQKIDSFAVKYEKKPYEEPIQILGWKMEYLPEAKTWPPIRRLNEKYTYTIPYYCKFVPTRSVRFPFGYLITTPDPEIVKNLLQHGVLVERLTQPLKLPVESFQLTELESKAQVFQGHHLNSVKGEYTSEEKTFPKGTLFVPTGQRLGSLAAYLLEPESDDGLLVWNFFDLHLISQWGNRLQKVPVYRILTPVSLVKETVSY